MTAVGLEEQVESVSSFSLYSSCRMPTLGAQTPFISGPNSQTLWPCREPVHKRGPGRAGRAPSVALE
jgi:hypothetical protein